MLRLMAKVKRFCRYNSNFKSVDFDLIKKRVNSRDFTGCPEVMTQHSQCRGSGFDLVRELVPACHN